MSAKGGTSRFIPPRMSYRMMFICAEVRVPRVLALLTRFLKASDIPTSSMAFPAWAILLKRYTPAIIPICSWATGATAVKLTSTAHQSHPSIQWQQGYCFGASE